MRSAASRGDGQDKLEEGTTSMSIDEILGGWIL